MKKILFVNNNLETGGVQTSLINLLNEIKGEYNVSLLLFNYKKEYEQALPTGINVLTTKSPFKHFGMSTKESKKSIFTFFARVFWKALSKLFGRSFVIKLMSPITKKISGYDVAISYLHEGPKKSLYGGCNEFVLNKVNAKKKIAWIHCDFNLSGANNKKSRIIYNKFDKIVACSNGTAKKFINCIPELASKTIAIRNSNDYAKILELSKQAITYSDKEFNLITVARLSEEKGIERAIDAVKFVVDAGFNVKYHIVGGGSLEGTLKQKALDLGLSERVVFYGRQLNPYKYIKNADLFLLPSYHEAAPVVFDEAMCLGVPVLTTNTTSAIEMVESENGGFVCDNSTEGIKEKLLYLLRNRNEIENVKIGLAKKQFNNQKNVADFIELIKN